MVTSLRTTIVGGFLAALALLGCSSKGGAAAVDEGDGHRGAKVELAATVAGPSATIGNAGGTLDGEAGTPLEGVHIKVPPGAFAVDTRVSIGRNSGTLTPAIGTWGGLILDLSTGYGQEFDAAIEVTLPFSGAAGDVPIPFYINPEGRLEYIDPLQVDAANHAVTFQTWHASSFTFIVARLDDPFAPAYDTGFDPVKHGFHVPNAGSTYNRAGECLGMSAFAGWFYVNHTAGGQEGFYDQFMWPVDGGLTGQDIIATRAYNSINQAWDVYLPVLKWQIETLTQEEEWLVIRYVLINQAAPVIVTLTDPLFGTKLEGHAVLGYSFVGDKLFIYDPNHFGTTQTIEYNAGAKQFKDYSISGWTKFATAGLGSRAQRESFERILGDAKLQFGKSKDAQIQITSHTNGDKVTTRDVTLTGQISSVEVVVEELTVNVGNTQILAPVDAVTGDFSVHVPINKGDNYLLLNSRGKNALGQWMKATNNYTNTKGFKLVGDLETTTILVTLTWDRAVDLDLYVTDPAGDTAWYTHKTTADGGELDIDVTSGYGPEHFTLTSSDTQHFGQPYFVKVHKYSQGDEFTNWTLKYSLNDGPPVVKKGTLTFGDSANQDPAATGSDWGGLLEIVPAQP